MYFTGNTLKLSAKFTGFDGQIVKPDMIKTIIYNAKKERVADYVPVLDDSSGLYIAYHVPMQNGLYYVEFYGELGGMPILTRQRIGVNWI